MAFSDNISRLLLEKRRSAAVFADMIQVRPLRTRYNAETAAALFSSRFRGVRPMEAPEENSLREQALSGVFLPVLPHGRWRGRQSAMEARIRREGQNGKEVREAPSRFRGVRPMEAP